MYKITSTVKGNVDIIESLAWFLSQRRQCLYRNYPLRSNLASENHLERLNPLSSAFLPADARSSWIFLDETLPVCQRSGLHRPQRCGSRRAVSTLFSCHPGFGTRCLFSKAYATKSPILTIHRLFIQVTLTLTTKRAQNQMFMMKSTWDRD